MAIGSTKNVGGSQAALTARTADAPSTKKPADASNDYQAQLSVLQAQKAAIGACTPNASKKIAAIDAKIASLNCREASSQLSNARIAADLFELLGKPRRG